MEGLTVTTFQPTGYMHVVRSIADYFLRQEWLCKRRNSPTLLKNFQRGQPAKFWTCWTQCPRWIRMTRILHRTGESEEKKLSNLFLGHLHNSWDTWGVISNITRDYGWISYRTMWPKFWRNWQELLTRFAQTLAHKTWTQSQIRLTQKCSKFNRNTSNSRLTQLKNPHTQHRNMFVPPYIWCKR